MSTSVLDKPVLWSFKEAAMAMGMKGTNDYRKVSAAVGALGITPKAMNNNKARGLDRKDLLKLSKAFGRPLQ